MADSKLTATYKAPDTEHTFSKNLPTLPSSDASSSANVETKTTYLHALRTNLASMQDDINTFLTKRMEDEKNATAGASNDKTTREQESKAEEMYGEEDPEAD